MECGANVRIRRTPAETLGHVYAKDGEAAIKKAIQQFRVQPAWQKRLLAIQET
jgi:hypothetical protein